MRLTRVAASTSAWGAILDHSAGEWPREACGLLIGNLNAEGVAVVVAAEPVANLSEADDAFELDPVARIAIQRRLREAGEGCSVLGHYHSHPFGEAHPSPRDLARADEAGLVWLVVSVGPEGARGVGAYVAVEGPALRPLALSISPERKSAPTEKKDLRG